MTTRDTIETDLERLSETVSLRTEEKREHRENVLAFMEKSRKPARSPFMHLLHPSVRYVSAFVVLLLVTGTGVVSAAGGAMPGDTLYAVKLKVTEPTQSAFIFDSEEKTEFEVERADRRLKELAVLSTSEDPDPEITALIADSLSESIAAINEDVSVLAASGEADQALETNADLQSLLSAHQQILARVEEQNPDLSESFDTATASVDSAIANTENVENTIEDALIATPTDDASVTEQATETETSREELRAQLQEDAAKLDTADQETVTAALLEIDTVIVEAHAAQEAGNSAEAYLLYTEADQRLNELRTLIEADRDLGIGVIE